jgi:4-hydroxythreonine-4-phosphate dehydrogenase
MGVEIDSFGCGQMCGWYRSCPDFKRCLANGGDKIYRPYRNAFETLRSEKNCDGDDFGTFKNGHGKSLSSVSKVINRKNICETIQLAEQWMKKMGKSRPKIGICALNPHAGEKGLIGKEEIEVIEPAIRLMRKKSKAILSGPLPADTAFRSHKEGIYDCLITMYHDQSMIPLKLFNSEKVVNVTLGLPFFRTSPGHGTAFDIAGKNCANPNPMKEAILTCAMLSLRGK